MGQLLSACLGAATPSVSKENVLASLLVPGAGLEPAQPNGREILSLLCLPIPPSGPGEAQFTNEKSGGIISYKRMHHASGAVLGRLDPHSVKLPSSIANTAALCSKLCQSFWPPVYWQCL